MGCNKSKDLEQNPNQDNTDNKEQQVVQQQPLGSSTSLGDVNIDVETQNKTSDQATNQNSRPEAHQDTRNRQYNSHGMKTGDDSRKSDPLNVNVEKIQETTTNAEKPTKSNNPVRPSRDKKKEREAKRGHSQQRQADKKQNTPNDGSQSLRPGDSNNAAKAEAQAGTRHSKTNTSNASASTSNQMYKSGTDINSQKDSNEIQPNKDKPVDSKESAKVKAQGPTFSQQTKTTQSDADARSVDSKESAKVEAQGPTVPQQTKTTQSDADASLKDQVEKSPADAKSQANIKEELQGRNKPENSNKGVKAEAKVPSGPQQTETIDANAGKRGKHADVQTEEKYIRKSKYIKEHEAKKEVERLLQENVKKIEDLQKEIKLKEAEIAKKSKERSDLERNKDSEISRIRSEKNQLEKEKEELLTRLSAMAGRKLTDNNPNIADLSDLNRPTKLAEKFSELYDNAWTDAFSSIQELVGYKDNEEKAVTALMNMLTTAYKVASDAAEKELTSLKENIEQFHGSSDEKLVKDVMKQLKDSRKKRVKPTEELKLAYHTAIVEFEKEMSSCDDTKKYTEQCLELCWLMVIQDPPVFLQCEACKKGDKFDKNTYREYTQGGPFVEFPVWPALFLEKGGALLSKGVVQCKKKSFSTSVTVLKEQKVSVLTNKQKSQSLKLQGNQMLEFQRDCKTVGIIQSNTEKKNGTSNSAIKHHSAPLQSEDL